MMDSYRDSFLCKYLLMLIDAESKKELHSEIVAVSFLGREIKYIRGLSDMSYDDVLLTEYYIRTNTAYQFGEKQKPHSGIFFTNRQMERFEELVLKLSDRKIVYECCHLETLNGTFDEVKNELKILRNQKESTIWLGEFL